MHRHDIERYRQALELKHRELRVPQPAPDGLAIERAADAMDELVFASQRDILVDTLNRKAELLSQVSQALLRTEDGSYGICLECAQPIAERRLRALPWAALCLNCQEVADRDESRSTPRFFSDAA
jgi:RNA polymerase-binding transcription factor